MSGKFIVIEGTDGGGKSTAVEFLSEILDVAGIDHITTREPDMSNEFSASVREGLASETLTGLAAVMAVSAARDIHIKEVINPALESGEWVICDRYIDSTLAYQMGVDAFDNNYFKHPSEFNLAVKLLTHHAKICRPDLCLVIDTDPSIALNRVLKRSAKLDKNERGSRIETRRNEYIRSYSTKGDYFGELFDWPLVTVTNNDNEIIFKTRLALTFDSYITGLIK